LGPVIAALLFSVAFTLLPAMITLLGALAGAAAAVLQRQGALNGALADEITARSAVLGGCTPAEISTCFATPPPC
jgi:hypothetical protein